MKCLHPVNLYLVYQLVVTVLVLSQKARIVVPPDSVNISLNDETVFTCTAVAHHISWKANNTPVDAFRDKGFITSLIPTPINVTEKIYSSQLIVTGSHFSNATEIICAVGLPAMGTITTAISEPKLLLVQGLLDAVTELQLNKVNASTLLISWNPPYTLEGVPVLYYCIKVNSSLNIHTENTTSVYYYSVIDIKPAQTEINVAVTILPVNKVGEGMATSVYTSILLKKALTNTAQTETFIENSILVTTIEVSWSYSHVQNPSFTPETESDQVISLEIILSVSGIGIIILICMLTATFILTATYYVIRKRRIVKSKAETVIIAQDNPAYDYIKTVGIVTQKNDAYEYIQTAVSS